MTRTKLQGARASEERRPTSTPFLCVHPTGSQFARHAVIALHRAGLLSEFWTCISWNSRSILNAVMPKSLVSELQRRSFPGLDNDIIRTQPITEMGRLALQRIGKIARFKMLSDQFSSDHVNQRLDQAVAKRLLRARNFGAVYSYEDIALRSFLAAKEKQLTCVYDLPTNYWRSYREIMREESERLPEWANTLGGRHDSLEKLEQKDRELGLADLIVVASSFTQKSLSLYPDKLTAPIVRIPYGAPPVSAPRRVTLRTEPLRILFVGRLVQDKGIAYLLDATQRLEHPYRLTLLGRPISVPPALERALTRHHWIPSLAHAEVLRLMREHDVLVFPSLSEGFGLVLLEAMSQGLVVVTTHNTAGTDIIADGIDGSLVPLRSVPAIVEILTKLSQDRDLLVAMSRAAQEKARIFSWARYEEEIVVALRQVIGGGSRCAAVNDLILQEAGD
jgi:starch synthase